MKKLLLLAALLVPATFVLAQDEDDYGHIMSDVAVRLDGGNVVSSGGSVTGGTCTNQVVTAIDTSGVPTCADITSAMIPAATITFADFVNGSALSVTGRSANSAGVQASIAASAASDAVLRESGSVLGFGTVATAGIANSAVTLAKIANAAANRIVLGSGTAGSGAAYTEIGGGSNTTISANPAGTNKLGFDPRTQWFIFDDFGMTITGITDPGSQLNWTTTTTNTPGNFVNRATTTANGADHPGILEMVGNAGNNAAVVIRETSVARTIHAGDVVECQINIRSAATGNGKYGCGFNDATTDPTSGTESLTIYYDSSVGANWVIRARQAAGGNAVASNLAVTFDAWHRLTVYVESIAGGNTGSVHYYVDGTELNVSPLSTNIPDQTESYAIELGFAQTTGGGAVALLWVDYIMGYGPLAR